MIKHIKVWRWEDAPADYKAISDHGGDEDWVALVPVHLKNSYIGWMEDGTPFGCCDVQIHPFADGSYLAIGAHA